MSLTCNVEGKPRARFPARTPGAVAAVWVTSKTGVTVTLPGSLSRCGCDTGPRGQGLWGESDCSGSLSGSDHSVEVGSYVWPVTLNTRACDFNFFLRNQLVDRVQRDVGGTDKSWSVRPRGQHVGVDDGII